MFFNVDLVLSEENHDYWFWMRRKVYPRAQHRKALA